MVARGTKRAPGGKSVRGEDSVKEPREREAANTLTKHRECQMRWHEKGRRVSSSRGRVEPVTNAQRFLRGPQNKTSVEGKGRRVTRGLSVFEYTTDLKGICVLDVTEAGGRVKTMRERRLDVDDRRIPLANLPKNN